MANVKVAINGFGRIGRLAFRQMFGAKGYDVVAINDLTNPRMLAHLLKYDSAQGRYALADKVTATDNSIIVDGKEIKIYAEKNAADLPWGEIGVDVVLECTGFYCSKAKSQAHIDAGAKKVVISAPAGNDLPTIVYSVNEKTLTAADTIISAASCTTNCLAPMANTLNKFAKIKKGYMTTIHAYTGDQMTLDGPHRKDDLRRARAAAVNIDGAAAATTVAASGTDFVVTNDLCSKQANTVINKPWSHVELSIAGATAETQIKFDGSRGKDSASDRCLLDNIKITK